MAQQSQIRALRSPKSRQKFRIAATIHHVAQLAGRAAWDAYSYGERAYDPPHVRHLLLVLSRRVADERSDAPIRARARGGASLPPRQFARKPARPGTLLLATSRALDPWSEAPALRWSRYSARSVARRSRSFRTRSNARASGLSCIPCRRGCVHGCGRANRRDAEPDRLRSRWIGVSFTLHARPCGILGLNVAVGQRCVVRRV